LLTGGSPCSRLASRLARFIPTSSSASRKSIATRFRSRSRIPGPAPSGLSSSKSGYRRTVELPPGPIAASGLAGSLFAGADPDQPLPIEAAFVPNPRFDAANELTVAWDIAPGYYLYRDKFTFAVNSGEIQFGMARLPTGVAHNDQNFGDVEVYYGRVEVVVPFNRAHPNEQALSLTAGYQGCKDESICYPPAEHVFELMLPASAEFARDSAGGETSAMESEQDRLTRFISEGGLPAVLGTFLVLGLGLSLTPCVYPMVPILSSIIAGQGTVSTGRSFALSVSYVLGMAVTYSVAGAITALAGNQVQAVFQEPWILASVAGLFVLMALAMFGLFELQMPTAIQSRINSLANRQRGGLFGTAVVGALSALIVTTCVAPPLIATLVAIGKSGEVARGTAALFVLAIGMGVPLLLIGASAGKLLPKVGPWMNTIKAGFGVVMLGMAIWMLERVVPMLGMPGTVTLFLWALLVFMTGVFLGAFESLPPEPQPRRRLAKGLGVLACLYGALMLIGATLGGDDPLEPIPRSFGGLMGQPAEVQESLPFVELQTVAELETLLASARNAGQPVMVDFTADWCVECKSRSGAFPPAQGRCHREQCGRPGASDLLRELRPADDRVLRSQRNRAGCVSPLWLRAGRRVQRACQRTRSIVDWAHEREATDQKTNPRDADPQRGRTQRLRRLPAGRQHAGNRFTVRQ
jgi:thiol:disulfide interchange protein DsbD